MNSYFQRTRHSIFNTNNHPNNNPTTTGHYRDRPISTVSDLSFVAMNSPTTPRHRTSFAPSHSHFSLEGGEEELETPSTSYPPTPSPFEPPLARPRPGFSASPGVGRGERKSWFHSQRISTFSLTRGGRPLSSFLPSNVVPGYARRNEKERGRLQGLFIRSGDGFEGKGVRLMDDDYEDDSKIQYIRRRWRRVKIWMVNDGPSFLFSLFSYHLHSLTLPMLSRTTRSKKPLLLPIHNNPNSALHPSPHPLRSQR
jgi:hypothetical protein